MTNPFPSTPQSAPTISDAAAAQFAPQHQQQAPQQNAFLAAAQQAPAQPQQQAYAQAQTFPGQVTQADLQAQQQAAQLPGQPWTPQQHQQNGQQMAAQAGYAPPATPQQFAPPVQQQAPAPAPQGFAPTAFPPAQQQAPAGGFPGAVPSQGGGFDPSLWGQPSAGGGGTYPKVRDLNGRLCLIRTKKRDAEGTAYGDATKKITNYIANVAVLDGGPLYASPNAEDVMAAPELVSEQVPYVISDMIIGQVGLHNRLKNDFVRGRIVRHPKGNLEKQLLERYAGMQAWQALFQAMSEGLITEPMLVSGTYFWTIIPDESPQGDQLVAQFAQNPLSRELML